MSALAISVNARDLAGLLTRNAGALFLLQAEDNSALAGAEQWLVTAAKWDASDLSNHLIAISHAERGHTAEAESAWEKLAADRAMCPVVYARRSLAEGDLAQALAWARQADRLATTASERFALAEFYEMAGAFDLALSQYEYLLAEDVPSTSKSAAYYHIGQLHQTKLQPPDISAALVAYENAATANDFQSAWMAVDNYLRLVNLAQQQGDLTLALSAAQAAVTAKPDHALAHTTLGLMIYAVEGDLTAAEAEMDMAAALDPTDVWPWLHRGQLYFQARQYEKAVKAYERALALNPGLEQAREMIDFIQGAFPEE